MVVSWRSLACATALSLAVGIEVADAQTVIVINAPPQSKIELVFNTDTVGTASVAPAGGIVTISTDTVAKMARKETSAHVSVDACTGLVRVLFVEAGLTPPPPGGCTRKDIAGQFIVRPVTTFVIDVGRAEPGMWLRQGPAPSEWLTGETPSGSEHVSTWGSPPLKLSLFGGGSMVQFTDTVSAQCGTLSTCSGKDFLLSYHVGAMYWMKPFLAAEVSYLKPKNLIVNGTGDTFDFQSTLETQMVIIAGDVGGSIGRARLYGQAGANYHRATSTTTETIAGSGTQTFTLETEGWGWLFGGGLEAWITHRIAIYGEFSLGQLKGNAIGGGQGAINEHIFIVGVGGRVHLGRR